MAKAFCWQMRKSELIHYEPEALDQTVRSVGHNDKLIYHFQDLNYSIGCKHSRPAEFASVDSDLSEHKHLNAQLSSD